MEFAQPGAMQEPLLCRGKIIVQTGSSRGSLLALNRLTGSEIWVNGSAGAGYASPIRVNPHQIKSLYLTKGLIHTPNRER